MQNLTVALDAMGGDFGPRVTVPAAVQALSHFPELKIELEVLGFGCSTNLTEDEAGALWIRVHVCNALIFKKIRIL